MCLIIASQSGVRPSKERVIRAAETNPHGFGVAFWDGERVQVVKGFRLQTLLKWVDRVSGKPYLIHLRYATSGRVDIENCHPFQIGRDAWLAHNGVIDIRRYSDEHSDTWHFARFVRDAVRTEPAWLNDRKAFVQDLELLTSEYTNKLAVIHGSEIIIAGERLGHWDGGIWYSCPRTWMEYRSVSPYQRLIQWQWDDSMECQNCGDASITVRYRRHADAALCSQCAQLFVVSCWDD